MLTSYQTSHVTRRTDQIEQIGKIDQIYQMDQIHQIHQIDRLQTNQVQVNLIDPKLPLCAVMQSLNSADPIQDTCAA